MTVNLDWENLGFSYMKLPYRYIAYYRNGQWEEGTLTEDATLHISESSPSLHYGQQAFEGLKAYRTKDDSIQLFRPDKNAERLQQTADRLLMPQVPTECATLWNGRNSLYSSALDWSRRYYWRETS